MSSNTSKTIILYDRFLDSKWTIKLINFGTIAVFIDYWVSLFRLAWPSILANLYNPMLWKMENNGEHHVLDIIPILFMYMFFAWRLNKIGIKMWGLFALYFWYVVISLHETAWWVSYLIAHTYFLTQWVTHSSLWLPDGVTIISFFVFYKIQQNRMKNKKNKINIAWKIPYTYLIFLIGIYAIWISMGFPVTVDYYGLTVYYYSNFVNFWEIFVWISTIFVFLKTFLVYNPELSFGLVNNSLIKRSIVIDHNIYPLSFPSIGLRE